MLAYDIYQQNWLFGYKTVINQNWSYGHESVIIM